MNCPNCDNNLNENDSFCTKCGQKKPLAYSLKNNILLKTKEVFLSNKKKIISFSIILFIILIGIYVFNICYGFFNLSWDETYDDYKLDYISQTTIELGILLDDEEKLNKLKFNATCGVLKTDEKKISWDLSEASGSCEITVSYNLRKIRKTYKIMAPIPEDKDISLDYKIDYESEEDLDLDKLTNKQEKEYHTNVLSSDSDLDGLEDYYEVFTSKTEPTKKDTDDDGLNDYDEIKLGLDPLKADSKGDGVKDGERKLTYDYTSDAVDIKINGTGNIASTMVEVKTNTKISNKKGFVDKLFTFYSDGKVESADVVIRYTDEEIQQNGLNEERLSVYYFNELERKYELIDTKVDKENNTLKVTLNHFSNYLFGDIDVVKLLNFNEVLFVLDNSWSMYTNEQYKEITGEDYYGGWFSSSTLEGSDATGKRFILTSSLIDKLSNKNYEIGLSEFREDYANISKIGSDTAEIQNKLQNMNGNFVTYDAGTNITNALIKGMEEFSEFSDDRYIILLTDGGDSDLKKKYKTIIDEALENRVKICSIGFGAGAKNTDLADISHASGCKFYSSSDVSGLTELFDKIETELNNDLVDIDGDSKSDGILLADSGFIVNRDGFSFDNMRTTLSEGHCYGMATFAELYFTKNLPMSLKSIRADKDTVSYDYNLYNTYFEDYKPLYDFKFTSEALKYHLGVEYFNLKDMNGYRSIVDSVFIINDVYKKEIEKTGLYDITVYDALASWNVEYKKFEEVILNMEKMQTSSYLNREDRELFNALYAGMMKMQMSNHYTSGTTFWFWIASWEEDNGIGYQGPQSFINILKTRLTNGDPAVISTMSHAVNAIDLIQDLENPNYYYIGVYDNNYPGEKRYYDLLCKNDICTLVNNKYYSNVDGEPLRITPSLESDLKYFEKYIPE